MIGQVNIRTDGNSRVGLGHIVRCISLAHMIKDDFDIRFYSLSLPDSLKKEIQEEGWEVTLINQESDFMASLQGDEIVVLDGYQFDSSYQKEIKDTGSKLVCIDDFHDQHFYADLVINHAPGVTEGDYNGESYTKYLLGPNYAMLRPEFLGPENKSTKLAAKTIRKIFICFGGSDVKNLIHKILNWLPKKNLNVILVVGGAYNQFDKLYSIINKRTDLNIDVKISITAKEIRNEMLKADVGIVPASGILFEAISSNMPVLSGYYVDNQILIYEGFKQLNVFIDVVDFNKTDFVKAFERLNIDILTKIMNNQTNVIDNKSGERISNQFKHLTVLM